MQIGFAVQGDYSGMNIIEISQRFNIQANCIRHLEFIRWENSLVCPYCCSIKISSFKRGFCHRCNACNKNFSVLIGTVFEDIKLPMPKWFVAIGLIVNAEKGSPPDSYREI